MLNRIPIRQYISRLLMAANATLIYNARSHRALMRARVAPTWRHSESNVIESISGDISVAWRSSAAAATNIGEKQRSVNASGVISYEIIAQQGVAAYQQRNVATLVAWRIASIAYGVAQCAMA